MNPNITITSTNMEWTFPTKAFLKEQIEEWLKSKLFNTATKKYFNEEELIPTKWLLKSIERERENDTKGRVLPVFSSVAEMKKWYHEHE